MEIIAFINHKGGVAKTSSCHSVGAGLAQRGYKVLLIDMDAQGSLSSIVRANRQGATTLEVLLRRATAAQATQTVGVFDIIAGSEGLAAEGILTATGKEYRLREALQPLQRYDYVLLDCPPSLGITTINALTAADSCIVPCQADTLSLEALQQLSPTIDTIRKYTNPKLRVRGILITRYNGRAILSREAVEMLEAQADAMGTRVYSSKIRESISVKEAQAMRQDIFTYAPKSNAAHDYNNLIDEIIKEDANNGKE